MSVATSYGDQYGEDFQEHILAVMSLIPGFVIRYRSALDHSYFVNDAHRTICHSLLEHVDKYRGLPTQATLVEAVRPTLNSAEMLDTEPVLRRLYDRDVQDANAVIERVVEFGKNQALVNAILKSADLLNKSQPEEIRGIIDTALLVGEDLLDVGIEYREDIDERRKWYTDPEAVLGGVRTGITHMDLAMGGGLQPGELGVILAPPKRGKTTCLINIGFGALSDVSRKSVAHYSLEMGKKKVAIRYDDRLMGARVKYKRAEPERYFEELKSRSERLLRGRLFIQSYATRAASVSTVRAHLALLASRGFHPDVVVVDYADIMKPERRIGEMRHEQAGIYEDLRTLAGDFECVVWTGSQAKMSALDKEIVTLADFAEASEKAAIVDACWAFCQTDDEKIDGRARLFAAGLRDHEDGRTVEIQVRRDCCLIRSTGLLDVGGTRLAGEDHEPATAVRETVAKAKVKDAIKKAGGIKRKKRITKKRTKVSDVSHGSKKKKRRPTREVE